MKTFGRFVIVVALLFGTGWFLHARERNEIIPPHTPLAVFPTHLDGWSGTDVPIDKGTADVLGPGDFLLRDYENQDTDEPPVYLFIAYFPSQRTGDTMHSPQNCLPGAGWQPVERQTVTLQFGNAPPFPTNKYVIQKGLSRQIVLYWYLAQGHAIASEYRAKIHLVLDAIRTNRSDGALIRLSTPTLPGESSEVAMQRLQAFAGLAVPQLDAFIPK
jgi:EpsI family protein